MTSVFLYIIFFATLIDKIFLCLLADCLLKLHVLLLKTQKPFEFAANFVYMLWLQLLCNYLNEMKINKYDNDEISTVLLKWKTD